jgi:hypothetical protein
VVVTALLIAIRHRGMLKLNVSGRHYNTPFIVNEHDSITLVNSPNFYGVGKYPSVNINMRAD